MKTYWLKKLPSEVQVEQLQAVVGADVFWYSMENPEGTKFVVQPLPERQQLLLELFLSDLQR